MKTVCQQDMCAGCKACIDICPKSAIDIKDEISAYNAIIDEEKCINCNACHKVCPNVNPSFFLKTMEYKQGWANDILVRKESSSGGIATALMIDFINNGGLVCSCCFVNGKFGFKLVKEIKELKGIKGSKYIKSDPKGIYSVVKKELINNNKVLFIALPCQIAAMKNYVGKKYSENLFTVDLICHGSPSPQLLEYFFNESDIKIDELEDIAFRKKDNFGLYKLNKNDEYYSKITSDSIQDLYIHSFLNCMGFTENCYRCQYARKERVSDITIGDSWGSTLSEQERKKGISLILCQTTKGIELINRANIHTEDVDVEKAIACNKQLSCPSIKPNTREKFIKEVKKSNNFHKAMFKADPIFFVKHIIKKLIK